MKDKNKKNNYGFTDGELDELIKKMSRGEKIPGVEYIACKRSDIREDDIYKLIPKKKRKAFEKAMGLKE